jgi:hypothetical protein
MARAAVRSLQELQSIKKALAEQAAAVRQHADGADIVPGPSGAPINEERPVPEPLSAEEKLATVGLSKAELLELVNG